MTGTYVEISDSSPKKIEGHAQQHKLENKWRPLSVANEMPVQARKH